MADARQAHRSASEQLDLRAFDRRVADLAELIECDAGARLTIDAVRDLLQATPGVDSPGPNPGSVLVLYGPMLRRAAPTLVDELDTRLSRNQGLLQDPALVAALERASGLLRDMGLSKEHDEAVATVTNLIASRGYHQLTVAAFDWLFLRLRDMPLPAGLRVVPAHQVFAMSATARVRSAVWDHPPDASTPHPSALLRCDVLPAQHSPAGTAVLLSAPALRVLADLNTAKRTWLTGRSLVTMDARALARFPGSSHHLAEFLVPSPETVGG